MEAVITYFGFSFYFIIKNKCFFVCCKTVKYKNTRMETKDLCKNDEPVFLIFFLFFWLVLKQLYDFCF